MRLWGSGEGYALNRKCSLYAPSWWYHYGRYRKLVLVGNCGHIYGYCLLFQSSLYYLCFLFTMQWIAYSDICSCCHMFYLTTCLDAMELRSKGWSHWKYKLRWILSLSCSYLVFCQSKKNNKRSIFLIFSSPILSLLVSLLHQILIDTFLKHMGEMQQWRENTMPKSHIATSAARTGAATCSTSATRKTSTYSGSPQFTHLFDNEGVTVSCSGLCQCRNSDVSPREYVFPGAGTQLMRGTGSTMCPTVNSTQLYVNRIWVPFWDFSVRRNLQKITKTRDADRLFILHHSMETALHFASFNGHNSLVLFFVLSGCDINALTIRRWHL